MDLATPQPASEPEKSDSGQSVAHVPVEKVSGQLRQAGRDLLAVEEPLEIRLVFRRDGRRQQKSISITMRTPGADFELACGFLLTEGIIRGPADVAGVRHCGPPVGPLKLRNVVRVELGPEVPVDFERLERHFYTSSSCGVCGKTSIAALTVAGVTPLAAGEPRVPAEIFHRLPDELRRSQDVFDQTGGLHAAALFETDGRLVALREDVGRHNAVDKLIGSELLAGRLPLERQILLVSGRASFELVQKALVARIPIMAAVGAPSSLAVELAAQYGLTLLGFLRSGRFNLYCGGERVIGVDAA
ncbi:MAG TPA: formate dehydrogenase accessory sulfurtransferase FdhD [Pirellulales bacterium]